MNNKVTTHQRFINKVIRDLKNYYHNEDFASFVQLFHEFIQMNPQTDNLSVIDMYYDSLFQLKDYEAVRYFSELCFQHKYMSTEESELHLKMILKSLDALKQYDELLGWTEIIMHAADSESISSNVYNEAKMYRNKATQHIETHGIETQSHDKRQLQGNETVKEVDIEAYLSSEDPFLIVQALESLIEQKEDNYSERIYSMFKQSDDILLKSMMVIYLKTVEFKRSPIEFNKFNQTFKKYTDEFKPFEKEAKIDKTIEWIIESGNHRFEGNESRIEQTIEIFLNLSILWYPLKVPFTPKELAKGFISYIKVLNNELPLNNFYGEVADWIMKIESEMND